MLDKILGSALQGMLGGSNANAGAGIMGLVLQLLSQPGALQSMLQQFQSAGLGAHAQSWVGTGANMPISPEDLLKVFGHGQMQAWGQQLGMQPHEAASGLSSVLPEVVNQLTPDGQVGHANEIDALLGSLRKALG